MEESSEASNSTTCTPLASSSTTSLKHTPSDSEVAEFLHARNLAVTAGLMPTVAYIVILSVVGIVGNTTVFLVYYRRFNPSVARTYILAMSVCDLLTSVLFLPTDFPEIRFHDTFYATWACKLSRFVRSFLVYFSAAVLVAVAVDRQRTICSKSLRPSTQTSFKTVYISLVVCALVAFLFAVPYAVLTGGKTSRFSGTVITGVMCTVQDRYSGTLFAVVYNVITGVAFVICVVIMGVSYGRIARFLWQHKKVRKDDVGFSAESGQLKSMNTTLQEPALIQTSQSTDTTLRDEGKGTNPEGTAVSTASKLTTEPNKTEGPRANQTAALSLEATPPVHDRSAQLLERYKKLTSPPVSTAPAQKIPARTTFMLFVLTVMYVVNFLPYIVTVTLDALDSDIDYYDTNIHHILLRFFFLNSVVNPFVYCFCNRKFRQKCFAFVCACR